MDKDIFKLDRLPFEGEWFTFSGGDTAEQNNHHGNPVQNFAFDFVIIDENDLTHADTGAKNEDYFAYGKDVFATADGEVVEAVDGVRDNIPLDTNDYVLTGNYAVIKHGHVYSLTAHLQQGSMLVKKGDHVKAGQKIGLCGNSGNSSEPHVHFHVQDSFVFARFNDKFERQSVAKAAKVCFKNLKVNGDIKTNYSPVRNDKVSNV